MPDEKQDLLPPSGEYHVDTVPANGRKHIDAQGDHFYFTECNGTLRVSTDQTADAPYSVGEGEQIFGGREFRRIILRNLSSEDVAFELFAGRNRRIDNRLNVVDGRLASVERVMPNSTEIVVSNQTQILNAGTLVFNGVPTGNQIQRKSLIVTNEHPNNALDWGDGTNIGGKIFAGHNIELEVAGSITIGNTSGGDITCKFTEIWFVNT